MVQLSPTGEVATFQDVDQFQPGHSAYECGFFAVAIVKAMNEVGKPPTESVAEMTAEAEAWYAQYDGNNSIYNELGMSLAQLYELLGQVGLHYQSSSTDLDWIRGWLKFGYPVIVAGAETGMYDMGIGDVVPYPWTPSGNHVITITGAHADGNVLVRDPANITPPNNLRPGPRLYDASRLQLISATAVIPPWLPRPPAGFDPRKESSMAIVPNGWHDDGKTLSAPNGHNVVLGFREYVLTHNWDAGNVPLGEEQGLNPLEESNPALGAGTQQVFNWITLEWTAARGIFEAWTGAELMMVRADKVTLQAQVNELHTQLTQSQAQVTQLTTQVTQLTTQVTQLQAQVTQLGTELMQVTTRSNPGT